MRRFLAFIAVVFLICGLTFSAHAATAAKSVSGYATITNDGRCQMTLTAVIHLDQAVENLKFPLPGKAGNVTVNGARARSQVENGLRQVDISRIVGSAVGDFTLTFTYTLPNLVATNDAGLLELQLPLLAGFAYPVQSLEFSVTLPGPVTAKPAFSSGYHQANIEKDIHCTTSGATITGISQVELKDHETLSMSLLVTEEMFPQTRIVAPNFQTVDTLITVFTLLALAYWVLFLRNLPPWPVSRPTPPEGYNAGELGSLLHLQGGNLNMMVFSWAELGYLTISLERSGRVTLFRRMDMGNERSAFERNCFHQLFGRRDTADASSVRYGELYRRIENMRPNVLSLVHPRSGNLNVFRGLAAGAGLLGGVAIGISLSSGAILQWLLVILLGALALVSSWYIQAWATALLSPDKRPLWIALSICGGWLLLGLLAGQFSSGLTFGLGQLLAGLLTAMGGRRTKSGKQAMGEVLGLRRYLRSVSTEQLRIICQNNPEYFQQMAPYALALGVDDRFARLFPKQHLSECSYISIGTDAAMRATQWQSIMRRVHKAMNTGRPTINEILTRILQYLPR